MMGVIQSAAAAAYGGALLLSFVGWGGVVARAAGRRAGEVTPDLCAAWGMAFLIGLGGWLNLLGAISGLVVRGLVAFGACFGALALRHAWRRSPAPRLTRPPLWLAALCVLVLARYFAAVADAGFNWDDDLQGYFVFPAKMLQLGGMGADPFSERRMVSLGGQSFLQTMVVSVLPFRYSHLIEPGVAGLMLLAMLHGYLRDRGASAVTAAVVLFAAYLFPAPRANTSGEAVLAALFLALYRTLDCAREDVTPAARCVGVPAGLVAAAMVAVKTTAAPAVALLAGSVFLWNGLARKPRWRPGCLPCSGRAERFSTRCLERASMGRVTERARRRMRDGPCRPS